MNRRKFLLLGLKAYAAIAAIPVISKAAACTSEPEPEAPFSDMNGAPHKDGYYEIPGLVIYDETSRIPESIWEIGCKR